jgi:molecular chaperone GrpE
MTEEKEVVTEAQEEALVAEETLKTEEQTAKEANATEEENTTEEKGSKGDKKKQKKLDGEIAELKKQIEAKDTEIAEQNDRYMRMLAEYDNFRKRTAKEKEAIHDEAYGEALKSILPIVDNLERAVGVSDAEGLAKGLELTLKGAEEALEKMGIEAFGAEGDAFDPNIHNAVMMVDDETHKEGEIVSVFQKGYRLGEKIIRYAMVTVAN